LGLPDRDYYLKEDPKSKDLRAAYVVHIQKMFELLGDKPEVAATEAQAVMKVETALARGSMTRVDRRDPKKIYHFMSVAELEKLIGLPNGPTPGTLKAEPEWDSLRGDPRFQKLLEPLS
jgi:putative endopeptidase